MSLTPHPLYCQWFAKRRSPLKKNTHYYSYYDDDDGDFYLVTLAFRQTTG
jgi:hypothetical protein